MSICAVPIVTSVLPLSGPSTASTRLTISGTNLGSGSDITTAMVSGAASVTILSQSTNQVVLLVTGSGAMGAQNVSLMSTSFGPSGLIDIFTFNARTCLFSLC